MSKHNNPFSEITPMQRKQAALNHIAARGHAALKVPAEKRTAQQQRDVALFKKTFGDEK